MSILVVGGGKMGLSHIAILNRLLDRDSVAICDSSRLTRYVFGKLGIATYKSVDDALRSQGRWRGAVVATPTSSHFAIVHSLLSKCIPCFIEKPLTLSPAHSQILVDLQQSTGTPTQLGLVTRFIQPFVRLREMTLLGALGRPVRYRARMMGNVVTQPDNGSWRTDFKRGGGCLNEYGPHLLDLCRSIFGEVRSVKSASYGQVHSTRGDDRFQLVWEHTSGTEGQLLLDWCDTSRRKSAMDLTVDFEYGQVSANNTEFHARIYPGVIVDGRHRTALESPLLPYPVNFYLRGEEFSLQLEVFLQRVLNRPLLRAGIDPNIAASIQDGLAVDRLINEVAAIGNLT